MTQLRSFTSRLLRLLGSSRHSALPVLRRRMVDSSRASLPFAAQAVFLACGATLIGTSVGLLVRAELGLPPYDVFASGVADRLGITHGQAAWSASAVLFVVASLLGRRPSIWGLAYVTGTGFAVDTMIGLLNSPETMAGRIGFLLAAIVVMAVGLNLVLHSGTTGGPFELLMLAGEDRGFSRTKVRYALDFGVLAIGMAIGGDFGPGTVAHAAAFGAVLALISQAFEDHRIGRTQRLSSATDVDHATKAGHTGSADALSTFG